MKLTRGADREDQAPTFDEEIETGGEHLAASGTVDQNLAVGTALGAAAIAFVFFVPFFSWFYLSQLNNSGNWRPAGTEPPAGFGLAIMIALVLSAALLVAATRARGAGWKPLVALALVLGAGAVVLQIVEYTQLSFGAGGSGYASVFVGWTGIMAALSLATMVWVEALLAYGLRRGDAPPEAVWPRLRGLAVLWSWVVFLSVVMWSLLYPLS